MLASFEPAAQARANQTPLLALRARWVRSSTPLRGVLSGLLAGLARQHGDVEPGQTQLGVGGLGPEGVEEVAAAGVVVHVDVAFGALDERQHIVLAAHGPPPLARRDR